MECPNQDKVDEHHETLYDATSGLVRCVHKKVSWKALGITILSLLGVLTTITLYGMTAEKKQNDRISNIPVIQKDIEYIKKDLNFLREDMKEIKIEAKEHREDLRKKMAEDKKDILKAILQGK